MNAALFNEKIVFQRNETVVDDVGNHKNVWADYYSCFAAIGGEGLASSKEKEAAGMTVEDVSMTVSMRYCRALKDVVSTGYRVVFHGEIYDIVNVDHMNYKKKSLKFMCRKARR